MANIDFENGTDGAAIVKEDVGGSSSSTSAGPITYAAAAAAHGSLGMKAERNVSTASTSAFIQWDLGSTDTQGAFRFYFNVSGRIVLPSFRLVCGINLEFRLNSDGSAYLAANGSTLLTTEVFYDVGSEYRVEIVADTVADTATINLYLADATTPINAAPYQASAVGMASTTLSAVRAGILSAGSIGDWIGVDDIDWALGSTTELGPAVTLPAAADTAQPTSVTSNAGGWTATGAANIPAALADPTDTATYISVETGEIVLREAPLTTAPRRITVPASAPIGPATIKIEAMQGSTVRATLEATALTTAVVDYVLTLTDTERSTIVANPDGTVSDLDIRVTAG